MEKKAVETLKKKQLEESQCNGICKNIEFKILVKEGKPSDNILRTIEEEGIDQIVIAIRQTRLSKIFTRKNNRSSSKRN